MPCPSLPRASSTRPVESGVLAPLDTRRRTPRGNGRPERRGSLPQPPSSFCKSKSQPRALSMASVSETTSIAPSALPDKPVVGTRRVPSATAHGVCLLHWSSNNRRSGGTQPAWPPGLTGTALLAPAATPVVRPTRLTLGGSTVASCKAMSTRAKVFVSAVSCRAPVADQPPGRLSPDLSRSLCRADFSPPRRTKVRPTNGASAQQRVCPGQEPVGRTKDRRAVAA